MGHLVPLRHVPGHVRVPQVHARAPAERGGVQGVRRHGRRDDGQGGAVQLLNAVGPIA
jgi:hypothetical protein